MVDPVCHYFLSHFVRHEHDSKARSFGKAVQLFGFARIFHPVHGKRWVNSEKPAFFLQNELNVEVVANVIGALGPNIKAELISDFGKFLSCLETKVEIGKKYRPDDVLEWWQENGSVCGSWTAAARLFALMQPSTASVERGFAMLRACVSAQQTDMLEDMIELRVRKRFFMKNSSTGVD